MDPIRQLWQQAKFNTPFITPKILYGYDSNNEKYIVINDYSSIYRLMNARGQVYMVANFRCKPDVRNEYYKCEEPLHIVSCTKYGLDEETYANEVIRPAVFK